MNISVALADGRIWTGTGVEQSNLVQLFRKPHDIEIRGYDVLPRMEGWKFMGSGYRGGPVRDAVINDPENPYKRPMPEVYRVYPDHVTPIPCDWLKFWRELNPMLSIDKFCTLLDNKLAWTNGTGFPERRNCLTGERMTEKDPAFHAPIINGGAILKGREVDGWLEIEGLHTSDTPPDPDDVINNKPWLWYYGTTVTSTGRVNYITRLGMDGRMYPVRIPILSVLQLKWPLAFLQRLDPNKPLPSAISFG